MGLQTDIGFEPTHPNSFQRALQRIVAAPRLSLLLSPLATTVDKALHRLTRGSASASAALVAFPTIMLTTTGARSGEPRTAPLVAIPVREDLAVIGSNAGSGKTPGWVFNLRAHPHATVSYQGGVVPVVARQATGDDYEEAFTAAARIYAGYTRYRERAESTIPVFVLIADVEGHKGET